MELIRQSLIEGVDEHGAPVQFVVLADDRCAVIRQGQSIYIGNGDYTFVTRLAAYVTGN